LPCRSLAREDGKTFHSIVADVYQTLLARQLAQTLKTETSWFLLSMHAEKKAATE